MGPSACENGWDGIGFGCEYPNTQHNGRHLSDQGAFMPRNHGGPRQAIAFLTASVVVLAGCTLPFGRTPAQATESVPTVVPTPTQAPARVLTICLGEEPNTLYP